MARTENSNSIVIYAFISFIYLYLIIDSFLDLHAIVVARWWNIS